MSTPSTALDEIQAAIEKLIELKEKCTPGPWFLTYEQATYPRIWGNAYEDEADHVATTADKPRNADLIVTLHRTIDAQLALLEGEVRFCGMNGYSPKGHIVELARAINGEPTK